MQDKDNKEKKPRIRFDWFFTLFIIMAIIGVITLINYLSQPTTDTLTYNEIIFYAEQGKIEKNKEGTYIAEGHAVIFLNKIFVSLLYWFDLT